MGNLKLFYLYIDAEDKLMQIAVYSFYKFISGDKLVMVHWKKRFKKKFEKKLIFDIFIIIC